MTAHKILITTSSFGVKDTAPLDVLREHGLEPVLNPYGRKLSEDEVYQLINDVRPIGMIAGVEPLTSRVLKSPGNLRVISRCGIGLDNVDLAAAEYLGIKVLNTPDAPTLSVAELTLGLILAVLRAIPLMDMAMRNREWKRPMGRLLTGKTVGIVGCGRIGSAVERLLAGFQCRITGYDPAITTHPDIELTGIEPLLAESDVVTLHIPYSEETHHFINADRMNQMKRGAVLINTSRGGLVDESSLFDLLQDGHLGGIGFDCFEEEPYEGPLTQCANSVLTGHVGSYAEEARKRMEAEAVENLLNALTELER